MFHNEDYSKIMMDSIVFEKANYDCGNFSLNETPYFSLVVLGLSL